MNSNSYGMYPNDILMFFCIDSLSRRTCISAFSRVFENKRLATKSIKIAWVLKINSNYEKIICYFKKQTLNEKNMYEGCYCRGRVILKFEIVDP